MNDIQNFVALLGTKGGPAIRPGSTMPTSSLLSLADRRIVVDCGLGVTRGLVDQGMHLRELDLIFCHPPAFRSLPWNWVRCCIPPGRPD